MVWPDWIEELKERYLADEGNVFVLHGDVQGVTFEADGAQLDCVGVLRRFLARTRPIVGVLRPWPSPSRLEFAGIADRTLFENLIKAHELVEGRVDALKETTPNEALARIWKALSTQGTAQAYLVTESERLIPGHRRRVDPVPGAPFLLDWPRQQRLLQSNNIVIFLTRKLDAIRAELVDSSVIVAVAPSRRVPMAEAAGGGALHGGALHADPLVPADVPSPPLDDPLAPVPAIEAPAIEAPAIEAPAIEAPAIEVPPPLPAAGGPEIDLDAIRRDLEVALVRTILEHPEAHRPARLPVMAAVSEVVAHNRPDVWGLLTFGLDDEAEVVVQGSGADRFLQAWRQDIALDAAAGMLMRSIEGSFSEQSPPPLEQPAVTALAKRIAKLLERI
ncbi:MAG TPA: hypothetical protein ENK18_11915 [Deltaproteobacteria bacterium]|nr:hypothetical protein [Deltaproteobacteria bacterium]